MDADNFRMLWRWVDDNNGYIGNRSDDKVGLKPCRMCFG